MKMKKHGLLGQVGWRLVGGRIIGWGIAGLLVSGCAGIEPHHDLPTVAFVDLHRYAGTWYEIARLPMWFQRHCVDSKAVYTIRSDGRMGVHNECITEAGETAVADGVAMVVDTTTNARLSVVFDNWFSRLVGESREGNYWIVDLDAEYHTAMVGTPDRRYLWILARLPMLDDERYRQMVQRAKELGYPVERLIRDRRPGSA